ncbi:DUF2306 domain-containing protein [Rubrivirga sp.]|uniref:DUF2306 domain-containing protein n=1 Tax=Rubrivirga sp. TaxID=1885344 RepID=UPI003C771CB6
MTPTAIVHTVLGVTALASGALVLVRRKGDRTHRLAGRVYVGTMLALCLLSFGLHDSTPFFAGYGPFHIAALVSLATVTAGMVVVRRRREGWLEGHYQWMAWSYIGLVMATGGHVMDPAFLWLRDLGLHPGAAIGISIFVVWGLPPIVGSRWIAKRQSGWDALAR